MDGMAGGGGEGGPARGRPGDAAHASDALGGAARPGHQLATWVALGAALVGVLLLASVRSAHGPQTHPDYPSRNLPPEPQALLLPPSPADDEYFPCSDCHEGEPTNRTVRELEDDHEDLEIAHGEIWCLDCHAAEQRDLLHLANEATVEFADSWRLCTQCHGSKLADWRAGVHGKRTGHWWGPKQYQTCVSCHDPHSPRFQPLEPEPPPRRPEAITQAAQARQETAREGP